MKTNSTLVIVIRIIAFVLLCLYSLLVFGQPKYDSISPVPPLHNFSGVANEKKIKIQWTLTNGNKASSITLEKGYNSGGLRPHAEYWVNMEGNYDTDYQWADSKTSKGSVYYRLKIKEANGNILYSNILHFGSRKTGNNSFIVYPSVLESSGTENLQSSIKKEAFSEVFDYSGKITYSKKFGLQEEGIIS